MPVFCVRSQRSISTAGTKEARPKVTWRVVGFLVLLFALCSTGTVRGASTVSHTITWPAPRNPLALARKAGLTPERHETLIHHVHAHLDVFVNGQHVQVPA